MKKFWFRVTHIQKFDFAEHKYPRRRNNDSVILLLSM